LNDEKQAELTIKLLTRLHETGVKITSISFDGLQTNFTMCKYLGATISAENPVDAYFPHLVSKEPIFILPDGCRLFKLIRNAFVYDDIYDADGNIISLDFLKKLIDVQDFQELFRYENQTTAYRFQPK